MSESDSLDFKREYKFYKPATDLEKADLLKDILALANSFKTSDAYIVVGVSEKDQRKEKVHGVAVHLKDNDVQQFINSKTNRRIKFLVHSATADGQPIDIIQIAQHQQRPLFAIGNFGNVKANEAWIRVGSSSAVANPDQIALMVQADEKKLGEVRIVMEWAAAEVHTRFGSEVTLSGTRLVLPAPSPKSTAVARQGFISRVERRALGSLDLLNSLPAQEVTISSIGYDNGPKAEQLMEYAQKMALFSPLRIWLKNLGTRNASNVKVVITIPKQNGIVVVDKGDLPKRPRGRFDLLTTPSHLAFETWVEDLGTEWSIRIEAKTIQPQYEFWASEEFYVASPVSQLIQAKGVIFADDLPKPIEFEFKINVQVTERAIAPADLGLEQ